MPIENFPLLELIGRVAIDVPLADQGGLVAGLAQFARIRPLLGIPSGAVAEDAIGATVLAGQQRGSARTTNGIAHEPVVENRPFIREPVNARRLDDGIRVSSNGPQRMIVTQNKKNVRLDGVGFRRVNFYQRSQEQCGCKEKTCFHFEFILSAILFHCPATNFTMLKSTGASPFKSGSTRMISLMSSSNGVAGSGIVSGPSVSPVAARFSVASVLIPPF